jgi:hypothetical protein
MIALRLDALALEPGMRLFKVTNKLFEVLGRQVVELRCFLTAIGLARPKEDGK